jgi:hypothetical protein
MTRRRILVSLFCVLISAVPVLAQSQGTAAADPISGTWVDDGAAKSGRGLELKYDGKGKLTGTVNPGQPNASPITAGTFDPKTGALKVEGEAKRNNQTSKFLIEATLEKDALVGTYTVGTEKGTFKFTRKKS